MKKINAISIFYVVVGFIVGFCIYRIGYNKGVDKTIPIAVSHGWNAALDSVNNILNKQIKSDSTHCTCLCIDTTKYYLHHKKL